MLKRYFFIWEEQYDTIKMFICTTTVFANKLTQHSAGNTKKTKNKLLNI